MINNLRAGVRKMVDSFNYVAWQADSQSGYAQQPAEVDDMKISYSDAKTLYLANPLAKKLVDKPIEYAMSKRPEAVIPGCPDDLIAEVWKKWNSLGLDHVIATAQRNKKIYGASAIVFGIEGVEPSYPATPQVIRSNDVWFNAVDALQMAGNIFDMDANSKTYGRLKTFRVNGKTYSRGRYHFESNGEMLYLAFEGSNFNFAGRSAFRNIRTPLDAYKLSFKAFKRIASLTGVLVHSADNSGSNLGISQKVRAQNIGTLQGIDAESVISVGQKDTVTNLQFQHVAEAMQARQAIIEDCASGSGVPAKILLEDSFASALASGNEDYRANIQWIEAYQENEIEPWYRYCFPLVLAMVCTEQKWAEYAANEPELSGVMQSEAMQQWYDDLEFKWPKLIPQTDEELQESKAKKLESIGKVFDVVKDAQWYADEVNALDLFENEVPDFQYQEPEPVGFGDEPRGKVMVDADRWITVHPNGKGEKGQPALIGEGGEVKGGMGGKFNGQNIKDAHGTKVFTSHETNAETAARHAEQSKSGMTESQKAHELSKKAKTSSEHDEAMQAHREAASKFGIGTNEHSEHSKLASSHHKESKVAKANELSETAKTAKEHEEARNAHVSAANAIGQHDERWEHHYNKHKEHEKAAKAILRKEAKEKTQQSHNDKQYATSTPDEISSSLSSKFGIEFSNGSGYQAAEKKKKDLWKKYYETRNEDDLFAYKEAAAHAASIANKDHNVKGLTTYDVNDKSAGAKKARKTISAVDNALSSLIERGFDIKEAMKGSRVSFVPATCRDAGGVAWGSRDGHGFFTVSYDKSVDPVFVSDQMDYMERRKQSGKPRWTSVLEGDTIADHTVRHEFAHALGLLPHIDSPKKLGKILYELHGGDPIAVNKWIKENISEYATTNIRETDAELCAMVTSPSYKKGMLPEVLERHVYDLFKYKGD